MHNCFPQWTVFPEYGILILAALEHLDEEAFREKLLTMKLLLISFCLLFSFLSIGLDAFRNFCTFCVLVVSNTEPCHVGLYHVANCGPADYTLYRVSYIKIFNIVGSIIVYLVK